MHPKITLKYLKDRNHSCE